MKDLLVIVPDVMWQAVIEEVVPRHEALRIRPCSLGIVRMTDADPAVRRDGVARASLSRGEFSHAMLIFDYHGCGDTRPPSTIEASLREALAADWSDCAEAFVVDPELEAWLIGATSAYRGLSARTKDTDARDWMHGQGLWLRDEPKPTDPKDVVGHFCRHFQIRPSAATYRRVARDASLRLERCQCPSFHRFVHTLRRWFPLT